MFGIQFLFTAALWALPLAGLPLVLHLMFRQKSQVIPFSTLRFIQSSLRQNATRKRVHRWLLLACRALLLLFLIWAIAQPAKKLAAGMLGGDADSSSLAAAVVVDTSYSMLLEDNHVSLLQKADDSVQDLLRSELRDADVAIFRGGEGQTPRLQPAENYRGDHWAKLTPTADGAPLVDRVAAAAQLLATNDADQKWLIVITDAQRKEFPRPISDVANIRTIFIDLHPAEVRSAAITAVHTEPAEPRLGIPAEMAIDLTGQANDSREVTLQISSADPKQAMTNAASIPPLPPLPMARFDGSGRAELRAPMSFSDPSWLVVTARLNGEEPLPWAGTRSELVRIPPRLGAAILEVGRPNPVTVRLIRLALDPSEGARAAWPVALHEGSPMWNEGLVIAVLSEWPDEATVRRMGDFVRGGGSLLVFVQPGLEDSWSSLSPARQTALTALLPSAPLPPGKETGQSSYHASIVRAADPILSDIGNAREAEGRLVVTRLVKFAAGDSSVVAIINAAPNDPDSGDSLTGLLWRRNLGGGVIYTWGTVPDRTCGNLRVWDIFPPSLVNAARGRASNGSAINVELGVPLTWAASDVPAGAEVDVTPPRGAAAEVARKGDKFIFADAMIPGLYAWTWRNSGGNSGVLGWTNAQIPAEEARLEYRPISEIASPAVLSGHSLGEIRERLTEMNQPRPQWTWPIAVVLLLLCVEGLLGALPKLGQMGKVDWAKTHG